MPVIPSRCEHCGYELRGIGWDTSGRQCPECGTRTPLGSPTQPWSVQNPLGFDGLLACGGIAAAVASQPFVWLQGEHESVPYVLAIWGLALLTSNGVVWTPRRRRATSTAWLVWHTAFACAAVPAVTLVSFYAIMFAVWMFAR